MALHTKSGAGWRNCHSCEKLQLSVFLPNDLSLDDWYAGVYALPTVWPDVSMLGATNLRRVVSYDFHHLRKKCDVLSIMWGNIHPQWRLLKNHLETEGPGWYPLSEREEWLFTNRSNRPGDDIDELRTDGDPIAWRAWSTAQNRCSSFVPEHPTMTPCLNVVKGSKIPFNRQLCPIRIDGAC